MLKVMPRYFQFDDKEVCTMLVWINLPGSPLEFCDPVALGKIVSKVGKPISTDKLTATKGRLSYARVLVEVDASIELVRLVKSKLPNGKPREQEIYFEHEPKFCAKCKVFGHNTHGCNLKKQAANAKGKDSDVNTPNRSHAASQMTSGQDTEIKHIEGTNFGPGYFDITKRTENC